MYCERGCSRTRADIHDGPEQPRPGLRSDNGAARRGLPTFLQGLFQGRKNFFNVGGIVRIQA